LDELCAAISGAKESSNKLLPEETTSCPNDNSPNRPSILSSTSFPRSRPYLVQEVEQMGKSKQTHITPRVIRKSRKRERAENDETNSIANKVSETKRRKEKERGGKEPERRG
jgi:hypothetical protein